MDNKKLTKILLVAGGSLLVLFILLRLGFKASEDVPKDNPDIKNVSYNEVVLPKEKSNQVKIHDEDKKKQALQGEEKEKYVYNNFNNMVKSSTGVVKEDVVEKKESAPPQNVQPVTYSNGGGVEKRRVKIEEQKTETPVVTTQPKSLFGTVKRENNSPVNTAGNANLFQGLKGEIYGDQKVVNGGGVVIRNKQEIKTPDGIIIPPNSILKGKADYAGNRVKITLTKAETKNGHFNVSLMILDNDNIEGVFYKAPLDEVKDESVDGTNSNINTGIRVPVIGGLANGVVNGLVKGTKNFVKKSRSLELADGYIIYILPITKKN